MQINCIGDLPDWRECRLIINNEILSNHHGHTQLEEEKPTALHRFIYEEEPADSNKAIFFRERLFKLIKYVQGLKHGD